MGCGGAGVASVLRIVSIPVQSSYTPREAYLNSIGAEEDGPSAPWVCLHAWGQEEDFRFLEYIQILAECDHKRCGAERELHRNLTESRFLQTDMC